MLKLGKNEIKFKPNYVPFLMGKEKRENLKPFIKPKNIYKTKKEKRKVRNCICKKED